MSHLEFTTRVEAKTLTGHIPAPNEEISSSTIDIAGVYSASASIDKMVEMMERNRTAKRRRLSLENVTVTELQSTTLATLHDKDSSAAEYEGEVGTATSSTELWNPAKNYETESELDTADSDIYADVPYILGGDVKQFRSHLIVNLIENMWFVHVIVILGCSYVMTFYLPQYYIDDEIWNYSCYWKLSWLLPLPYTLICFLGLVLPFRPAPTPDPAAQRVMRRRRLDNLYVCIVTRGSNAESVHRSYYSMRHLETVHPAVRVHVLTDEPYYYPSVECWSCPKEFVPQRAMYKARALEWYRRVLKLTEYDWILHLDEESVIDSYSLTKVLEFIWYSPYTIGQGPILYNHHAYWTNPFFTVADAIRVGDDIARFHLQYTYVHVPVFGAHGSFLLTNGAVENSVTWDVASLTEDYAFVNRAWSLGFRCGAIPAIVREQSPTTLADFLKQRRRWYVGIRRLPGFLPKLWNFFWTMGTLALYGTVASVILGVYVPLGTPRWLGAVKDFSFVVFVYLYVVGIFLQDVDAGYWPPKVILHIIATFFLQFVACVVECVAVMYAIFSPPAGFDIIRK